MEDHGQLPPELQQRVHQEVEQARMRSGWPASRTLAASGIARRSGYRWPKEEAWAKARPPETPRPVPPYGALPEGQQAVLADARKHPTPRHREPAWRVVDGDVAYPSPSTSSGAMRRFHDEMDGHFVYVATESYIRDTRPKFRYMWPIRVYDPEDFDYKFVLHEHMYDDQLLAMLAEQEMSLTFEDIIEVPLPPGTYIVELVALMVTPQHGAEALDDSVAVRRLSSTDADFEGVRPGDILRSC